jgi:PAS domain S-box-containing protein
MSTVTAIRQAVPKNNARILIVEDEQVVALDLSSTLENLGYVVIDCVISGAAAIESALAQRPDLILMDIRLDGTLDGVDAAQKIHDSTKCPIIFLTAYSDEQTLSRAKKTMPFGFLVKPFKMPELRCTIEIALHKHQAEERLREQERWFSTTLRSLMDAVIATGPDNKVRFLNTAAELLTGWMDQEAKDLEIQDILKLVRVQVSLPAITWRTDPVPDDAATTLELQSFFINRQGKTVEVDDATAPIIDDAGTAQGCVTVLRDVTQQRRNQEEIRQLTVELDRRVRERTAQLELANLQLSKVSKIKDEFLRTMSLELRTPLNSIIGFSMLFQQGLVGGLTEPQRKFIRLICESSNQLLSLINDLLELSDIDAGKILLELETLDVDAELSSGAAIVVEQAGQSRIELQPALIQPAHILLADRRKLRHIICNLLTNAVNFSRDGAPVVITAREVPRAAVQLAVPTGGAAHTCRLPKNEFEFFVEIAVQDHGIGIADPCAIFHNYLHIDSSQIPEHSCAGLGLTLVQQLAELHGGTAGVTTVLGEGSTFVAWLPLRSIAQAESALASASDRSETASMRLPQVVDL